MFMFDILDIRYDDLTYSIFYCFEFRGTARNLVYRENKNKESTFQP